MSKVHCTIKIQNNISEEIQILSGLRQENALSCLVLIKLLPSERCEELRHNHCIFCKSVAQLLAYADDMNIIARSMVRSKQSFNNFTNVDEKMGLKINEGKTKLMVFQTRQNPLDSVG